MSRQEEQLLFTAMAHMLGKLQGLGRGDAKSEELIKRLQYAGDQSERQAWNVEVAAEIIDRLDMGR